VKFLNLPYFHRTKKTIFDTPIHIFGTYLADDSAVTKLMDRLARAYELRTPLIAQEVSPSSNFIDAALTDPLSAFRIMSNCGSIASVACTIYNFFVLRRYYRIQGNKLPVISFCTISLVLNLTANLMRIAKSIDVLGVGPYLINYIYLETICTHSRPLLNDSMHNSF
jgi:hypothetical protein